MEDVFWKFAFGGEVLNVGIYGGDGSDGSSEGDSGFSVSDLLGVIVPFGFSGCLRRATLICTMSLFAASEAKSFSDASGMVCWGELFQMNGVNFHGVRIFGRVCVGRERGEGQPLSLLKGHNASFLFVEVNGFFHPGLEGGGNFLHGVDHGSNLGI